MIIFYTYKAERLLQTSNTTGVTILRDKTGWIVRILKVLRYYSILVILIILIDWLFFDYAFNRWYQYPVFVGMALITYWLGIEGFSKKNESVIKVKTELDEKERSQLEAIAKQLNQLMINEKVYKNPDLTLKSLSDHLSVKPYITTKCLNIIIEQKFSDYINTFRIEELKSLLKDPKNERFTLLSLAFEAGFNSKASFNRAVKKITGKSPSSLKSES